MGNSCHVPVIAWLLKELFAPLGLTPLKSLADVIQATAPGRDTQLQSYLRRPPPSGAKGGEAGGSGGSLDQEAC